MTELAFTIPGEPATKARPRVTMRGGKVRTYTPDATKRAEAAMGAAFIATVGRAIRDERHMFAVEADFYCGTGMRRDVDNMVKLVLDGLNKIAWDDDHQVMTVVGRKHFVDSDERTDVTIRTVGIMPNRKANCLRCGVEFPRPKSHAAKKYCSDDCRLAERRARRQKVCPGCGETFTAHSEARGTYCSRECHTNDQWTEVVCAGCGITFDRRKCHVRTDNYCTPQCRDAAFFEKRKLRSKGVCADCGGPTSDKRKVCCQPCRWARQRSQKPSSIYTPRPTDPDKENPA